MVLCFCNTRDMKQLMIDELKKLHKTTLNKKEGQNVQKAFGETMSYKKLNKLNNICENVVLFYSSLCNFDAGIEYFNKTIIEKDKEIKLYILLKSLFSFNEPQLMLKLINDNLNVKPRDRILKMKEYIEKNNELPEYF